MPELPEVEMARRYLQATSLHRTILSARVLDERILAGVTSSQLEQALTGRQFDCALRHGKRLFLKMQENLWLTLHLGLTGNLVCLNSRVNEPKHTRLRVIFEDGSRLAFDDLRIFGEAGLTRSPEFFLEERKIGPDALQQNLNGFLESMLDRRWLIKQALINQRIVAGLGNLYADEALFQAGICPRARSLSVEQLAALFSSIQETLRASLAVHADLEKLPDTYLLPHRHPGGRCPLDGALLSHEKIGGRTSYFCPVHQKMPEQVNDK